MKIFISGVIGTNKADAADTARAVLADLPGLPDAAHPEPAAVDRLLSARGIPYVTWEGWKRLERFETELGARDTRDNRTGPRSAICP